MPPTQLDGSPWPAISVVTPSYNQAPFLEETIRSILLQGYPALDLWVMDGGSADGSVEIIRRYEPWLAGWVSERDAGQTDAIRKGWARCRGELLAWLNSDDLFAPGALATVGAFFAARPDVDVGYGACDLVDEGSRFLARVSPPPFSFRRLLAGNFVAQQATFLRRRVVERLDGVNPNRHYVFDYELWLRAALHGFRLEPIPGPPLAAFRLWEASKTGSSALRFVAETQAVFDELFASPLLPAELRDTERAARSGAWREASFGCYRAGNMAQARHCLREMARLDPARLANGEVVFLWLRTLLGPSLNARARRWRRRVARTRIAG